MVQIKADDQEAAYTKAVVKMVIQYKMVVTQED